MKKKHWIIMLCFASIAVGFVAIIHFKDTTSVEQTCSTSEYIPVILEDGTILTVDSVQQIIDSLQSKSTITQQDIDFVREHSTNDRDIAWCIFNENKLRYDSLWIRNMQLYRCSSDIYFSKRKLAQMFEDERMLFLKYRKSCIKASCTSQEVGQIGSATGISLFESDISEDCCHQLLLADEDVLMHLCGDQPTMKCHQKITQKMIDAAYAQIIEIQEDCENNDSGYALKEYSRENKQNLLRKEQKAWNRWMSYRATISKKLPEDSRIYFDNGTNNVMRHKLIQLKNQYADIGVVSNDILRCNLPMNCSDKDLMEYTSFDHIWSIYIQHSGDPEWNDWKRSMKYTENNNTITF